MSINLPWILSRKPWWCSCSNSEPPWAEHWMQMWTLSTPPTQPRNTLSEARRNEWVCSFGSASIAPTAKYPMFQGQDGPGTPNSPFGPGLSVNCGWSNHRGKDSRKFFSLFFSLEEKGFKRNGFSSLETSSQISCCSHRRKSTITPWSTLQWILPNS